MFRRTAACLFALTMTGLLCETALVASAAASSSSAVVRSEPSGIHMSVLVRRILEAELIAQKPACYVSVASKILVTEQANDCNLQVYGSIVMLLLDQHTQMFKTSRLFRVTSGRNNLQREITYFLLVNNFLGVHASFGHHPTILHALKTPDDPIVAYCDYLFNNNEGSDWQESERIYSPVQLELSIECWQDTVRPCVVLREVGVSSSPIKFSGGIRIYIDGRPIPISKNFDYLAWKDEIARARQVVNSDDGIPPTGNLVATKELRNGLSRLAAAFTLDDISPVSTRPASIASPGFSNPGSSTTTPSASNQSTPKKTEQSNQIRTYTHNPYQSCKKQPSSI